MCQSSSLSQNAWASSGSVVRVFSCRTLFWNHFGTTPLPHHTTPHHTTTPPTTTKPPTRHPTPRHAMPHHHSTRQHSSAHKAVGRTSRHIYQHATLPACCRASYGLPTVAYVQAAVGSAGRSHLSVADETASMVRAAHHRTPSHDKRRCQPCMYLSRRQPPTAEPRSTNPPSCKPRKSQGRHKLTSLVASVPLPHPKTLKRQHRLGIVCSRLIQRILGFACLVY